jgi:hypothetical protein
MQLDIDHTDHTDHTMVGAHATTIGTQNHRTPGTPHHNRNHPNKTADHANDRQRDKSRRGSAIIRHTQSTPQTKKPRRAIDGARDYGGLS